MSQKAASKSHSAFFLSTKSAEGGESSKNIPMETKSSKRQREDIELIVTDETDNWSRSTTPTISPSSSVITLTNSNTPNLAIPNNERQSSYELEHNYAAIKLERLTDKIDRYRSHDGFLTKCLENIVIPTSYQVFLEPSIGNHDETFLKGYHELLTNFSTQVMKYTADYVKQKVADFEKQHETEMKTMCDSTPKEEFIEIKKALATNRQKRTKALREIKERKFIRLKYRAKTGVNQSPPITRQHDIYQPNMKHSNSNQNEYQPTNRISRRNSRTQLNRNNKNSFNADHVSRQHLNENLHNRHQNRTNEEVNTNQNRDNKIEELQKQIDLLCKPQLNNRHERINTKSYSNAVQNTNDNRYQDPKNGVAAPSNGGNTNVNQLETTQMLEYISTALKTLTAFEKRLMTQQATVPTHSEQ